MLTERQLAFGWRPSRPVKCAFLVFLCLTAGPAIRTIPADTSPVVGMEALHRLDLLPQLRRSKSIGSISSYDRTGGNDDGFSGKFSSVAKEDGGLVIADLKGPGVIYRIWTPTPTDDWVEFYFDGESEPRIRVKFRDLFTGKEEPFSAPLTGYGAGGFYSYVPLPYRQSCKVLVRAERVQFYQINYACYAEGAGIESWNGDESRERAVHRQKAVELFAASGGDISDWTTPPDAECLTDRVGVSISPGESDVLFEQRGPGRVVGFRLAPAAALAGKDRDLLLRIRWDDDSRPAVLCPVGDFFGFAWGRPAMKSLLVGVSGDTAYCYFPMPFERSAKIELVSERPDGPPVDIRAEIMHCPVGRRPDEGRFYAVWRRENPTTKGVPFTFVETKGEGHIVGCILQSQGMVSGRTPFFEGDDQTTIDGRQCIHGTGSEDFFNGGWYDVPGRWEKQLSFPLSGCLGYQKHLGRTGGYRLMLGDAYAFRKSILQTIEHAPTNNDLETDYSAVTFLYCAGEPTCDRSLPPLAARKVRDFDQFVFTPSWSVPIHAFTFRNATLSKAEEQIDGQRTSFLSMKAEEKDWFGPPFVSLVCEIPASGRYAVSIEAVKGPEQAEVQLFQNEASMGDAVDLYAEERTRSERLQLGELQLEEGPTNLMFKLVGKNEQSHGFGLDLITIHCQRVD